MDAEFMLGRNMGADGKFARQGTWWTVLQKQEVGAEAAPYYLLGDFVLPILATLSSVGLEILGPKGDIADTTRASETTSFSCHWDIFGLHVSRDQQKQSLHTN